MHFLVLLSALVVCAAGVPFITTKPTQDESGVPLNTKTPTQDELSVHLNIIKPTQDESGVPLNTKTPTQDEGGVTLNNKIPAQERSVPLNTLKPTQDERGVPLNTIKPTKNESLVRGYPTDIQQNPHQVALQYLGTHVCGGSIISPTCVVTAAHCVVWMNTKYLTVRAGTTYYYSGGTIHYVTGGFYHGSYNQDFYQNYDVAVLRVDPPFTYSFSVQSITLQDFEVYPGTYVHTSGWGANWPGRPRVSQLYEDYGHIRQDSVCHDMYSGTLSGSMICAETYYYGDYGFFTGDAGGPLITPSNPRRLVGILSWGWNCEYPYWFDYYNTAVYTKVSAVRNWILNACSAPIVAMEITKIDAIP